MSVSSRVVVVGAGHAGIGVAAALRSEGHSGEVIVLGDEADTPYQRPPLSKEFLLDATGEPPLALRSERFYSEHKIDLRTGCRVVSLDTAGRAVRFADGSGLDYDNLVLATGASARLLPLPGAEFAGVMSLRTITDARLLRARIASVRRVVIIGSGFVGLELATALRARSDVTVTVIDVADRVLARAVSPIISRHLAAVHSRRGVKLLLGTGVSEILGRDGIVTGVRDSTGQTHDADLVIVGIGAIPRTDLAERAGLQVEDGVVVDSSLRSSNPHVFAIGDCARRDGIRLESVPNASEQAAHAARVITGTDIDPYTATPWFWSEQAGLRLQMVGLIDARHELQIVGDPAEGAFTVLAFQDGKAVAAESVNRPADHLVARRLFTNGYVLTRDVASAPGFQLKSVARSAPA